MLDLYAEDAARILAARRGLFEGPAALDDFCLRLARDRAARQPRCDYTIVQLPILGAPATTDLVPIFHNGNTYAVQAGVLANVPPVAPESIGYVTDYGADPTGVADSTAAFTTALQKNQWVIAPPGTYLISSTIWLQSGQRLSGCGMGNTTIKVAASFPAAAFVIGCGNGSQYTKNVHGADIIIESFFLNATAPSSAVNFQGIVVDNVDRLRVRGVHTKGVTGYSISLGGLAGASYGDSTELYTINPGIFDCVIENPGRGFVSDGIGGGGTISEVVDNCLFFGCTGTAMDRVSFIDGLWFRCRSYATVGQAGQTGGFQSDFGAVRWKVVSCVIDGSALAGTGNYLRGFVVYGTLGGVAGDGPARPSAQYDCEFVNCYAINVDSGFYFSANNSLNTWTNQLYDCRVIGGEVRNAKNNAFTWSDAWNCSADGTYVEGWNDGNNVNGTSGAAAIFVQQGANASFPTRGNHFRGVRMGLASHGNTLVFEGNGVAANYQQFYEDCKYYGSTPTATFVGGGGTTQQSQVRRCFGWGYVNAAWSTPGFPATGVAVTNITPYDQMVYINWGAAAPTGVTVDGIAMTYAGSINGPFFLPSGASITPAYGGAATGWIWQPVNNS